MGKISNKKKIKIKKKYEKNMTFRYLAVYIVKTNTKIRMPIFKKYRPRSETDRSEVTNVTITSWITIYTN